MPLKKTPKRAKIGDAQGGRPSKWKFHRQTKLIRVLVEFVDQLLELALYMDEHDGSLPNTSSNSSNRIFGWIPKIFDSNQIYVVEDGCYDDPEQPDVIWDDVDIVLNS